MTVFKKQYTGQFGQVVGADHEKRAITHKYDPVYSSNEHNVFVEEYFSGPDVRIYLDGEEQREISQLSYSVQEQLRPIYSYGSYIYDDVAVGNRIVVGSMTIPLSNTHENNLKEISFTNTYPTNENINAYERPAWVSAALAHDQMYAAATYSLTGEIVQAPETSSLQTMTLKEPLVNQATLLRAAPSEQAFILDTLQAQTPVTVLDETQTFWLVRTPDKQGYILKSHLN